jgi:hypothetical protein
MLSLKEVMILFCESEVERGYKCNFVRVIVCVIFIKLSLRWIVKLITMEIAIKCLSYMFDRSVHFKITNKLIT